MSSIRLFVSILEELGGDTSLEEYKEIVIYLIDKFELDSLGEEGIVGQGRICRSSVMEHSLIFISPILLKM